MAIDSSNGDEFCGGENIVMKERLKKLLPASLKYSLKYLYGVIPPRFRHGKVFWDTYNFLQESQRWSKEKLEEYQLLKLNELVTFCSKYVPFYQKRWVEFGVDIKSLKDFSDFSKLPFTTKEDIICYRELMVPTIYRKNKLILKYTGGTTDWRASFYVTKSAYQKELAYFARYWKWHSFNFMKDDCVIFRATPPPNGPDIIKKIGNNHIFSSFGITTERLKNYIKYIKKFKVQYMQALPHFAYQLFKAAYENSLMSELTCMHTLFCASEKLYNYQKDFIERKFDVKVYDHYGHNELGALFQQCKYNDSYHIVPEYGYTEFDPVKKSDHLFEIISTGFNNLANPLIRYKTKDYARLQKNVNCGCSLKYSKIVKEIEGRSGDVIITPNGKIIVPSHLENAQRHTLSFIDWQIIQDSLNHLTLLIVLSPKYVKDDENRFKERILTQLDEKMDIDIRVVDKINKPISQKKRRIISKLET